MPSESPTQAAAAPAPAPAVEMPPVVLPAGVTVIEPGGKGKGAAADAKAADGKAGAQTPDTGAKPSGEPPKPTWHGAMQAERKAREAVSAADAKVAAAEARAKSAEDKANARIAELEKQATELKPLLDAVTKKDARAMLAATGLTAVEIATMVADEGKAPTIEDIKAAAVAEATAAVEAKQKERDDKAAVERKKADEERAVAEKKASDEKFVAAVTNTLTSIAAELAAPENAETYADALDRDALELSGADGETYCKWGKGDSQEITITGGTLIAREATALTLKVLAAEGKRLTAAEAIKRVQDMIAPSLQKLAERRSGRASPKKQQEKKPTGEAAQPTLSTRATTGPVTEPEEDDDGFRVDEAAVLKAARASLPHLRPYLRE